MDDTALISLMES